MQNPPFPLVELGLGGMKGGKEWYKEKSRQKERK